jgi:hypothetical protein
MQLGGLCSAPQYVAKELLPGEGFTDIQYVAISGNHYPAFASGEVDISMAFTAPFLVQLDAGLPITLLGGVHVGCYELVGTGEIRAIRDLKGKSVGVPHLGSAHHLFLSSMLAYVGLDPRKDINWITHDTVESARLLADRKVDALGVPAGAPGVAGEEDRPCDSQQRRRSALVPILLLHGRQQSGVRSQAPGRHQAGTPRDLEGDRHLRHGAGPGRANHSRWGRLHKLKTVRLH